MREQNSLDGLHIDNIPILIVMNIEQTYITIRLNELVTNTNHFNLSKYINTSLFSVQDCLFNVAIYLIDKCCKPLQIQNKQQTILLIKQIRL